MIQKITFRDEVKRLLLEMMFRGELNPGDRIALPSIAEKLQVSVTPVREALSQLEVAEIVTYIPNRGFLVSELQPEEACELYDVIAILESEALASAKITKAYLTKLEKAHEAFTNAKDKHMRVFHDMEFHRHLIAFSSNSLIKRMTEDLRVRVFFSELMYMAETDMLKESECGHDLIIQHLREKNIAAAQREIRKNWKLSIARLKEEVINE